MLLSVQQKVHFQSLYETIKAELEAKYGTSLLIEGLNLLLTDATGNVTGLAVQVNIESPPDADGDTVRMRKTVNIW